MVDIRARVGELNIFQLRELNTLVVGRINHISGGGSSIPTPGHTSASRGDFKRGDLVEFYSSKKHRQVRLVVDRINTKTLGGRESDTPSLMWRVPLSMCRLVGADKVAALTPLVKLPIPPMLDDDEKAKMGVFNASAPSIGAASTAVGAGNW